jgi:hypothetical protein
MSKFDKEVVRYATQLGATSVSLVHGGKHQKLTFTYHGKPSSTITVSCSPKDPDSALKAVKGDVNRAVKALK